MRDFSAFLFSTFLIPIAKFSLNVQFVSVENRSCIYFMSHQQYIALVMQYVADTDDRYWVNYVRDWLRSSDCRSAVALSSLRRPYSRRPIRGRGRQREICASSSATAVAVDWRRQRPLVASGVGWRRDAVRQSAGVLAGLAVDETSLTRAPLPDLLVEA